MVPAEFLERLDRLLKATEDTADYPSIPDLPEFYSGSVPWVEHKRKLFDLPRTALLLNFEEVASNQIDRTATFLSGPFFTSEEFPWPYSEEYSWEPLIQINLGSASADFGRKIGTGLLQIWKSNPYSFDGYVTRHIPVQGISTHAITPVPDELFCDPEKTHAFRARTNIGPWGKSALFPVSSKRVASIHDKLESYLESLAYDWSGPHELVAEAEELRESCSKFSVVDGDYLFGNYYPRGFDASIELLLAHLSCEHFFWGDDGKGILLLPDPANPSKAEFSWFS